MKTISAGFCQRGNSPVDEFRGMRNWLTHVCALLLLIGLTGAAPLFAQPGVSPSVVYRSSAPKKAGQLWEEALENFQAKDLEKSLKLVSEALRLEPGFVDAHFLTGDIYAAVYRDSLAVDAFQRGLALDPDYQPAAWLRLANLFSRMQRFSDAIPALEAYAERSNEERKLAALAERDRLRRLINAMSKPVHFNPKNLGDSVNSTHAEYLPCLSLDDSTMVFTRRLDGLNEDFFLSRRTAAGWSSARNLGPPINTSLNEGAQHLSADGHTLLFTMCNQPDGLGSCDLYESVFTESRGWSAARNLGPVINSPNWDSQPCLSANGRTLYFSSNRPGGLGERDLWVSRRSEPAMNGNTLKPGEWTSPVNLGPVINTPDVDQAPFLHPDGATLYLTSEGHGTLGGTDLFLSRIGIDGTWQAPENLGYPINTPDNEGSLTVSADGLTAYYASDRQEGRGLLDIYSFTLPEHLRARPVSYIKAIVEDAVSGKPLTAAIELTRLDNGEILTRSVSDPGTGEFLVVLPAGFEYSLNVMRKNYLFHSEHFNLPEGKATEPYLLHIKLQPIAPGGEAVLRNVFFATGSAALDDRSRVELQLLFRLLQERPALRIRIGGHTDDVGSEQDNSNLSEKRAKSVMDFLIGAGIPADRLEFRGYGESKPLRSEDTEVARALNRRTTFEVLE